MEKDIKKVWLTEQLEKSFNMVSQHGKDQHQPILDVFGKIAAILCVDIKELRHATKKE